MQLLMSRSPGLCVGLPSGSHPRTGSLDPLCLNLYCIVHFSDRADEFSESAGDFSERAGDIGKD